MRRIRGSGGTWRLLLWALAVAAAAGRPAVVAEANGQDRTSALRAEGLEAGYNLDHDEADAAFRRAIAADPQHPAAYRLSAALTWIRILWTQGDITVDRYFGQPSDDLQRPAPPAHLATAFRTSITQAIATAERRLRHRPDDAETHFHAGAAYGLLTLYQQSIEGRISGGLGTARRAVHHQERALALDARRMDAGLQLGLYRYGISTLALPLRIVARAFGLAGGKAHGIRLVEGAAAHPSELQTNARLALIAIYNREGHYAEALGLLADLQRRYPRNRLLWFEAAATALLAGRLTDAARFNSDGLNRLARDPRPRAPGEEHAWQQQRASIQLKLVNGGR